jgi:hypothetical protein
MTKLEDQISSARTMRHMTVVLFILAEVGSLTQAYRLSQTSTSPFSFMAYGWVLVAALPYLVSRNGFKLLSRFEQQAPDAAMQAALSQQISNGALMAYAILFFTWGVFSLSTGWRG